MAEAEKAASESDIQFRGTDGTALRGTLRAAPRPQAGVLLAHGLTGDKNENGLYSMLARRLDEMQATSLRFDLRGHGESSGRYEDVTMSGVINDIASAYGRLADELPRGTPAFVVAASFAGGLAAYWASDAATMAASGNGGVRLAGLVLLCPLFDYGTRMLFGKPYWNAPRGALTDDGADMLAGRGWLDHDGGFRIGKFLLGELCCLRPQYRVKDLAVPLLTVHGDADDVAPYETSHRCTWQADEPDFTTIPGAGHMFVHPDDCDDCGHPATRRFRGAVCEDVAEWIDDRI